MDILPLMRMNRPGNEARASVSFRLRLAVAAVALAGLAAHAQAQNAPRRASVDYNTANDYYYAVTTGRHRVVEMYHLGPCERSVTARRFDKAMGECGFILRIFPNHPQALSLVVRACEHAQTARKGDCDLGELFAKAVAINPKAADTYVIQGIHLHNNGKFGEARQSYERALALDADSTNGHYNLGLACLELKDYACANKHAQEAYALGAQLPGLRDRLQKAGHWNASARPEAPRDAQASAPGGGAQR